MSLFPSFPSAQFPSAQCPVPSARPSDSESKFRKLLPKLPPIRKFGDLRAPAARAPSLSSLSGDAQGSNAIAAGLPTCCQTTGGDVLLPVDLPCRLLGLICDQWDLYAFVVPAESAARRELPAVRFALMPEVVDFLRAQARRICAAEIDALDTALDNFPSGVRSRGAALCVELSPARWYALLYFCCATHGATLDPVRDCIEPVLWAYEKKIEDGGSRMEDGASPA